MVEINTINTRNTTLDEKSSTDADWSQVCDSVDYAATSPVKSPVFSVDEIQILLLELANCCSCLVTNTPCKDSAHYIYRLAYNSLYILPHADEIFSFLCTGCPGETARAVEVSYGSASWSRTTSVLALAGIRGSKGRLLRAHTVQICTIIALTFKKGTSRTSHHKKKDQTDGWAMWWNMNTAVYATKSYSGCAKCHRPEVVDIYQAFVRKRTANARPPVKFIVGTECDSHAMDAIALVALRLGAAGDSWAGVRLCPHVALSLRSGLPGITPETYIRGVIAQSAAQASGRSGDVASGWGAARVAMVVEKRIDTVVEIMLRDGCSPLFWIGSAYYGTAYGTTDGMLAHGGVWHSSDGSKLYMKLSSGRIVELDWGRATVFDGSEEMRVDAAEALRTWTQWMAELWPDSTPDECFLRCIDAVSEGNEIPQNCVHGCSEVDLNGALANVAKREQGLWLDAPDDNSRTV